LCVNSGRETGRRGDCKTTRGGEYNNTVNGGRPIPGRFRVRGGGGHRKTIRRSIA